MCSKRSFVSVAHLFILQRYSVSGKVELFVYIACKRKKLRKPVMKLKRIFYFFQLFVSENHIIAVYCYLGTIAKIIEERSTKALVDWINGGYLLLSKGERIMHSQGRLLIPNNVHNISLTLIMI